MALKKSDWILIGVLIVAGMMVVVSQHLNKQEGSQVEITVDGEVYKKLNLNKDEEVRIPCEGGHYNIVQVRNGAVDMLEADCKNQVCVKSARIDEVGETIVCLPHKVIVKIIDH